MSVEVPNLSPEVSAAIAAFDLELNEVRIPNYSFTSLPPADERAFSTNLLNILCDSADISRPYGITSHRKVIGRLIVFCKNRLIKISRPVIQICFRRQLVFNDTVIQMAHTIITMEARIQHLEQKLGNK